MRVVAGTARGRPLAAPPGTATRPTADRVREAVFNALFSLGYPEGCTVLDLFAGSGALGIEALSRGADRCTFVEADRRAAAVIEANLRATGLAGERAVVVRSDVMTYLATLAEPVEPVQLVLADPPYAFDGWAVLLDALTRVRPELVVIESDRPLDAPGRWRTLRERRYGGTVVTFAEPATTSE